MSAKRSTFARSVLALAIACGLLALLFAPFLSAYLAPEPGAWVPSFDPERPSRSDDVKVALRFASVAPEAHAIWCEVSIENVAGRVLALPDRAGAARELYRFEVESPLAETGDSGKPGAAGRTGLKGREVLVVLVPGARLMRRFNLSHLAGPFAPGTRYRVRVLYGRTRAKNRPAGRWNAEAFSPWVEFTTRKKE